MPAATLTPAALLADPQAFAYNLLAVLLDAYGTEALSWTPETIEMELRDDFNVDVPPGNFDRLMTAIGILTSDAFFTSPVDFARGCLSLAGTFIPANQLALPDSAEVAWGVTEALLIEPPPDEEEGSKGGNPFSEDITAMIGVLLDREGILTPPDVLRIATRDGDLAARVSYEWSDEPEVFSAIQKFEAEKTERVEGAVRARLSALLDQLQALRLTNGKAGVVEGLRERMARRLPPAGG